MDEIERLVFKVEAEDSATNVLNKIKKNLDSFDSSTDKPTKYINKQLQTFRSQMGGMQKAFKKGTLSVKSFKKLQTLQTVYPQLEGTRKLVSSGSYIKGQPIGYGSGFVSKQEINLGKNEVTSYVDQFEKNGNKITQVWKEVADDITGQTKTINKVITTFAKPKIFEDLQGKIVSKDEKTGIFKTEEILDNGNKIIRTYKDVTNSADGYVGVLNKATETLKKNKKETDDNVKKSRNLGKGLERIKRIFQSIIAFRAASAVITILMNAFKKGFEALKQANKKVAESMQPFQNATTQISISFATMFLPVMQALATILDPLAEDFINMANAMSLANAQAKGQSEYFKLSQESINAYAKSLNKTNKQLSQLDKFATLSGNKSVSIGSMVTIDKETIENQKNEIKNIQGIILAIKNLSVALSWLMNLWNNLDDSAKTALKGLAQVFFAVISPLFSIITILTSFATILDANASEGVKNFASALIGLASAMLAFRVAMSFLQNPVAGLVVATSAGILAGTIAGIVGKNVGYGNSSSQGYASNAISSANQNYSPSFNVQTGGVYLDGRQVGYQLEPIIYESGKKQRHW